MRAIRQMLIKSFENSEERDLSRGETMKLCEKAELEGQEASILRPVEKKRWAVRGMGWSKDNMTDL